MSRLARGRALSNLTSTVILSAMLLSIMITANYLSHDVLNAQLAASEFKTAENLIITIDSEINKLLFKSGSSSVIKTSFLNTAPGYTLTGNTLNLTIQDSNNRTDYTLELNNFDINGRQIIGGAFEYDVQGSSVLVVTPYNGTLGRIHVSKPINLKVSLDYARVCYTFTGIVSLFNGSEYVPHNTLEITSVILSLGEFNVTGNSIIIIRNEEVKTDTLQLAGNIDFTVTTTSGGETIALDEINGANPDYDTVVNFHRVYIRISVLEGG